MANIMYALGSGLSGGADMAATLFPYWMKGKAAELEEEKAGAIEGELLSIRNAWSGILTGERPEEEVSIENEQQMKGVEKTIEAFANAASRKVQEEVAAPALLGGIPLAPPAGEEAVEEKLVTLPPDFPFANHVNRASEKSKMPVGWIYAMGDVESGNVSGLTSRTGVAGPMQVTKGTGSKYISDFNPGNEEQSYEAGAKYMADLMKKYQDTRKMAAAYNGGEAAVDQAVALAKKKGSDWLAEIPNTDSAKQQSKKYGYDKGKEIVNHVKKFEAAKEKYGGEMPPGQMAAYKGPPTGLQKLYGGGAAGGVAGEALEAEVLKGPPKLETAYNRFTNNLEKLYSHPDFIYASSEAKKRFVKNVTKPYAELARLQKGFAGQELSEFQARLYEWGRNVRSFFKGEMAAAKQVSGYKAKNTAAKILTAVRAEKTRVNRFRRDLAKAKDASQKRDLIEEFREYTKEEELPWYKATFNKYLFELFEPGIEIDAEKIDQYIKNLEMITEEQTNILIGMGAHTYKGIWENTPSGTEPYPMYDPDFDGALDLDPEE